MIMKKFYVSFCLIVSISVFYSCQKGLEKPTRAPDEIASVVNAPARPICGTPTNINILDYDGAVVGSLTVSNDASNYYFDISENLADYKIEEVRWIYGSETHVRNSLLGIISCGSQVPQSADQINQYSPGQDQVSLTVPLTAGDGNCIFFHAHIKVVKRDPFTGQEYYEYLVWSDGTTNASQNQCQRYFQYCQQNCTPPSCGQLRTQTQGGWGAPPH
jgi:hypothetical protein